MLSRIAESMFWIGRYVERAEDTARILDVQTQLLLEDAGVDEEPTCRTLLSIMGVDPAAEARVDTGPGARATSPTTRPRRPRSPRRWAPPGRAPAGPARRCRCRCGRPSTRRTARSRRGQFRALRPGDRLPLGARPRGADQRHRRRDDDPRRGLAVPDARPLHRARRHDLAAGRDRGAGRRARGAVDQHAAGLRRATRRSCAPTAAWRPTAGAAEFLLLDRLFPRSVVFALNRAEQCLDNLEAAGQRAGFQNEAQRLLGRTRAELEYRSLSDVVADLPSRDGAPAAHLRPGDRGGHPALLRRRRGH